MTNYRNTVTQPNRKSAPWREGRWSTTQNGLFLYGHTIDVVAGIVLQTRVLSSSFSVRHCVRDHTIDVVAGQHCERDRRLGALANQRKNDMPS